MRNTMVIFGFVFGLLVPALRAEVGLQDAFPLLAFTRPLDLEAPGDGSNRLFVVEQRR
jgi:hypothetical protein